MNVGRRVRILCPRAAAVRRIIAPAFRKLRASALPPLSESRNPAGCGSPSAERALGAAAGALQDRTLPDVRGGNRLPVLELATGAFGMSARPKANIGRPMAGETEQFSATQRDAGDGAPGATAAFPYDRMTVERFRAAFPRARWRDDLGAWFVPGATAERRLNAWSSREWSGVLAHADARGRDACTFEPITSPYLEVADDLVVRTPYSRDVVSELRLVPWARWDPASKAWRVPFRSFEELRRRWPAIEDAARRAEPEERRKRAASRRASPEHAERLAEAAERRRNRYPVPGEAQPPLGRVLQTHLGCVVFEAISGEVVEPVVAARFYPAVEAGAGLLIWSTWRRPTHDELVRAWPAREAATQAEIARGWWQPALAILRAARRGAASLERARATRSSQNRDPAPGAETRR